MSTLQADQQQHELARAFAIFNQTSEYLSRSYQDLQKRVTELTAELGVANRRLGEELHSKDALSRRLEALIEALPGGLLVLDPSGLVTEANPAAKELFGADTVGKQWKDIRDAVLVATAVAGEWRVAREPDVLRVSVASRVLDDAGATVLLINNITEQYRAQLRESRRQRLASMGEMSASLAHQLRTPLATCLLYAEPLGGDAIAAGQREHFHGRLMAGLHHLDKLVRDMLSFVRGKGSPRAPVAAAELLSEAAQMVEPQAQSRGVRLRVSDRAGAARVMGCRKSLVGAIYNLLDNALNACPGGGQIDLVGELRARTLRLTVRDDGKGIDTATRERLFEPFFTTRPDGNGLGLAIVRNIARAHGGDAELAPLRGRGSEFVITLPLAAATQGKELVHG